MTQSQATKPLHQLSPVDVVVWDAQRQPPPITPHPCAQNNGNCSHLCLLAPDPPGTNHVKILHQTLPTFASCRLIHSQYSRLLLRLPHGREAPRPVAVRRRAAVAARGIAAARHLPHLPGLAGLYQRRPAHQRHKARHGRQLRCRRGIHLLDRRTGDFF